MTQLPPFRGTSVARFFQGRGRVPLAVSFVSLALTGSGCVDIVATGGLSYVEREEKRFSVSGRPDVVLSTFDGSIEIRAWDRSEVVVEVEKYALSRDAAADIEVRAEQNGNRVTVDARLKSGARHFGFGGGRSAKLIVSMPDASDVQATSGDGAIDIADVAGRVELRSGDGSIHGRDLAGDVKAQTG